MAIVAVGCSPTPPPVPEVKGSYDDAQKLYDQGKLADAEKILDSLKTKNPSETKTHFLLGRIYKETQRPDELSRNWKG